MTTIRQATPGTKASLPLLMRILLSFASVILVFSGMAWLNLWSVASFRQDDARVAGHLAAIDALREVENRLSAQEAVLDAYIASAETPLKEEFLGSAGQNVDAAIDIAADQMGMTADKRNSLTALAGLIKNWRQAADIDMTVLLRQPVTQKARLAVRDQLSAIMAEERQAIDAARQEKDATANLLELVSWAGLVAALLVGALAAWWLMRTVQRPIVQLTGMVEKLIQGNRDIIVPATHRRDEIGTIARAIDTFKDSMSEAETLRAEQERLKAQATANQHAAMQKMADEFEASVRGIVHLVASAATELQATARSMSEIADGTRQQAITARSNSNEATSNAQIVASATADLALSVNRVYHQIGGSKEIAHQAVTEIDQANSRISGMVEAADRIGSVVRLIAEITKRTNTLALNATIEASRAGEAGRGFAVVAAEVRTLADQIAKATTEIATMVTQIQEVTRLSVEAITHVSQTIGRISDVASTVTAAVQTQGQATDQISTTVQQAAASSRAVSLSIGDVTDAADATGTAAGQVLTASGELSQHSEQLLAEVDKFVGRIREQAISL